MNKIWSQGSFVKKYNDIYQFGPKAIAAFLRPLSLKKKDVFVDFGCGNGAVVRAAAKRAAFALGIDNSTHQLRLARAAIKGLDNARIVKASLLECHLGKQMFTTGVSRKALHHLTDPEKKRFFRRISPNFASGALFLLEDAMFTFARKDLGRRMPEVMAQAAMYYGRKWEDIRPDFIALLADEYPTDMTVWEQALAAGGFVVVRHWQRTSFYGGMVAVKE